MAFTKITFEVRHDYGDYTHNDALDTFDTYEEALELFNECVKDPGEDDDSFELTKVTETFENEDESEWADPTDGEMEMILTHEINEATY